MPKKNTGDPAEAEHVHAWFQSGIIGEERCKCMKVRISQREATRREEEWQNYFKLVWHSLSFNQFKYVQAKWAIKDMKKVIEIGKIALQRVEKDEYMSRPNFPDPSGWEGYVIV